MATLLVGFLVYRMFLAPLAELNGQLSKAVEEADAKETEWKAFIKAKRDMEYKRLLGLPQNVNEGVTNYDLYLRTLFLKTSLSSKESVNITDPKEADTRNQANRKGQPGHVIRTFLVSADVTWPRLLYFLAKFQETPFLHRIKSFTIERPSGAADDILKVKMAIETLSVARSTPPSSPGKYDPKGRPENLWGVNPRVMAYDAVADICHAPIGWAMILRARRCCRPRNRRDAITPT